MEAWKRRMFRARSWFYRKTPQKHQKTHTHGSMKKTNVSSEVLSLPKNLEKCAPRAHTFWAPKYTPKWVQEQPKTGSLFGVIFGLILGSLLGVFWVPSGPQAWPRRGLEEPKRAKWSSERPKRQLSKSGFRISPSAFFPSWDPPRRPQEAQKTAKERPEGAPMPKKRSPNASLKKNWFWDHFWNHFGDHFGAKIEAKTRPETEPIFETRLL